MKTQIIAAIAGSALAGAAQAQLSTYSQDFESLNPTDAGALSTDGWNFFGNVFDGGGGFVYGYGVFPAPTTSGVISAIATGEGGAPQGAQQLNIFNDYNNADHVNNPTWTIETNVFQEQTVGAENVGETWTFSYDYKTGNAAPGSALAFIKTLDPGAGFATTNFLNDDTSDSALWSGGSLSITIDSGLVGQILQFGFLNTASNFSDTGVFYDNVNFVPAPSAAALLGLGGLIAARRRR